MPHATKYFKFYLTKDSYDFSAPLKWTDLEDEPFCTINTVTLANGRYTMSCPLPAKTGRRILYVIWQRSDSQKLFIHAVILSCLERLPLNMDIGR